MAWRDSDEEYCQAVAAELEAKGVGTAGYTQTGGNVHCVLIPTAGGGEWSFGLADVVWEGCHTDGGGVFHDQPWALLRLEDCPTSGRGNPWGDNPAPPEYVARRILEAIDFVDAEELDPAAGGARPLYDRREGR